MRTIIRAKKGFTLIELVVVICIIAVLIAVLAPSAEGLMTTATETVCRANCETLQKEITLAVFAQSEAVEMVDANKIAAEIVSEHNDVCPLHGEIHASVVTGGKIYASQHPKTGEIKGSSTIIAAPVIVYCTKHADEWVKGDTYNQGDFLITRPPSTGNNPWTGPDLIFQCLKTHKSGSRSNTRNPAVKSNKGSWMLVGTVDGSIPPYTPVARWAVGYLCTYNGNIYSRTTYNLTGGQTPYPKSSSTYWTLIGPVESTEP